MIDGLKVLAMIPARGGSKRIPRKNLAQVNGRTLLDWTYVEAKKSRYIDRLILSSEDEEIIAEAKKIGLEVPFVRPAQYSQDSSLGTEPIFHALEQISGFDVFVLLQTTSPMRTVQDIDVCIEILVNSANCSSVVSMSKLDKKPEWLFTLAEAGECPRVVAAISSMSQTNQELYCLNGAIYAIRVADFFISKNLVDDRTRAYIMPRSRALDIDFPSDLEIFRALVE